MGEGGTGKVGLSQAGPGMGQAWAGMYTKGEKATGTVHRIEGMA